MMGVSQEVTPLLLLSLSGGPGWVSILLRMLVWTWGLLPGGWELGGHRETEEVGLGHTGGSTCSVSGCGTPRSWDPDEGAGCWPFLAQDIRTHSGCWTICGQRR